MIKLIACDIDGTLLQNGETRISPRFFREAARLADRGTAICAASGRQYESLRRLFAPLSDRMYFLCENGAVVCGPGGSLLTHTVIDRETSLALCRDILAVPECELLISGVNTSYLCPKTEEYVSLIRDCLGNNTVLLPAPEQMGEDFVKISAWYAPGAEELERMLAPRWSGEFRVAVAGKCWLDFTRSDKATGILALSRVLDIPVEDMMAFGDNYNDVAMLDTVGHPCIMASAAPELVARYPLRAPRPEDILETL